MKYSFPYGIEPDVGYWGVPTSTIDWCEENYVVSPFIAECVNTLTNATFIALAISAIQNAWFQKHELRFVFTSIGILTVGVGSWLFHMTLWYEFQLLDELPMIYATCIPYWVLFSFGKDKAGSALVALQISSAAALLTGVYLHYRNPTIHQAGYAVLNVIIIFKSVELTRKFVTDKQALANLTRTFIIGITSFVGGYGLWNVDIHLCNHWRSLRRDLGIPWGFLLEFHGWWHLGTGLGVYCYVVYLEYLRLFLTERENLYEFKWALGFIPRLDIKSGIDPASVSRLAKVEKKID